ncbi:MAG: hypothetical protein M1833_004202 [Piccolia ochrophora]|nr:MAG: hypothetical protein M1833_004202 [Piccolia ochrophora]
MVLSRHHTILLVICPVILFLIFSSAWHVGYRPSLVAEAASILNPWEPSSTYDVPQSFASTQNRTLGFERIFAVGLKERSDRRDALTLQADLTGMHVDWVDGYKGRDIVDKAVPIGVNRNDMGEANVGSWRGHIDTIRSMLDNDISTALILEDDVDWDVRLKSQLINFARGARFIRNTPESAPTLSPYGDDWDVLWLGHCGEHFPANDSRRFVISGDPSVPAYQNTYQPENDMQKESFPEHTRIVHTSDAPICTFAYAVSRRGAQKIMYALSVAKLEGNFDNALAWFCQAKTLGARCVSVQPTYFFHHRPAGTSRKDSDINRWGEDNEVQREVGFTENIRWSVRLNMEQIITNTGTYHDQYPDPAK